LSVSVVWTVPRDGLDDAGVVRAVEAALAHGGRPGLALAVVLVDDPALAELHGRFLDDPTPTDVMAFDLGDEGDGGPAGEVYVSVDRARALATERGVGLDR
jgi:probable rRNA maturation factor